MAKQDDPHPWQQIESQAFHAFREWPLWLVLRQRELAQQTTARPAPTADAATTTEQSASDSKLAGGKS